MPQPKPPGNPSIADAKQLAYALRRKGVIVLAFDGPAGGVAGASYGMTRPDCDRMGRILDRIIAAVEDGTIEVW
jgi:hypothetical protein